MTIKFYTLTEDQKQKMEWHGSSLAGSTTGKQSLSIKCKCDKELTVAEDYILSELKHHYLSYATNIIIDCPILKPMERNNLLNILYSSVRYLENNFPIDFSEIRIDTIDRDYKTKCITIKLKYNNKPLKEKPEYLW